MENKSALSERLSRLKQQVALLEVHPSSEPQSASGGVLPVPLAAQAVHDLYAATPADGVAVNGFGLGLSMAMAKGKPVVWAIQDMVSHEVGRPYAPGLVEMGLNPDDLLLVRARDMKSLLSVGEEALRSPAVGAVLLSSWGESPAMTLTATKRLVMAAKTGGGTCFLARAAAEVMATASESRWSVASGPSVALEANSPGHPCFSVTLQRQRGGGAPRRWILEWNRDRRAFVEPAPLSGDLVSVAPVRPAVADTVIPWRRSA